MKLNLGCGTQPLEGYENLDAKNCRPIYPLEFPDGSVDEIRASHCLEHFGHAEVAKVLEDWSKKLKPGGVMKIAVPDLSKIVDLYQSGARRPIQWYLMGGQVDEYDFHKTSFDRELLSQAMRSVGIGRIKTWESELDDCAKLDISLNLEGVKLEPIKPVTVECAMSVPRLGFMDAFFCWAEALLPLGIKPYRYVGAFWGQCLERVMEDIANRCDYVLTTDYDSIFTRANVEELIRLAQEYPEADAISAIQLGRGSNRPLMTIPGPDGKPCIEIPRSSFDSDVVRAATAHFGLTLIRSEALKRFAHPWFLGTPGPDGKWGEGKIDDDTHFWLKWREAGNTLYVAPRVCIGHAELVISWPDHNFNACYQYVDDWAKGGKPPGTWS